MVVDRVISGHTTLVKLYQFSFLVKLYQLFIKTVYASKTECNFTAIVLFHQHHSRFFIFFHLKVRLMSQLWRHLKNDHFSIAIGAKESEIMSFIVSSPVTQPCDIIIVSG